ncbi:MAG: dihydrodipicolinate reductase C-terminal domain-containing protein [Bdellovibrio sp.]
MKKIKVGLLGASGRMGQEIVKVLESHPSCELFYFYRRGESEESSVLAEVDVWIDFSSPEALEQVLQRAAAHKKPVVSGTTGFTQKEKDLLAEYSKQIPILWSSNMSMGVAVLNEALKVLSSLPQFDFQIEEFHHNKKKDKPSGTALTLQENLEKVMQRKLPEPVAIRGGGIFGIHKIYSMSDEEVLVFEHTALNRAVFAKGAVRAAEWITQKKPGLYQMRDVLFG